MAEEDIAHEYMDDEEDFEWMYVEDTCPLAVSHAPISPEACRTRSVGMGISIRLKRDCALLCPRSPPCPVFSILR